LLLVQNGGQKKIKNVANSDGQKQAISDTHVTVTVITEYQIHWYDERMMSSVT